MVIEVVESRAISRTDLEVCMDWSMIENWINEQYSEDMTTGIFNKMLHQMNEYALLITGGLIWQMEVMVFQIDSRAYRREVEQIKSR